MTAYDHLADEYYDAERHPTCRNFRQASEVFLRELDPRAIFRGHVLELGAGDSLIAKLLREGHIDPEQVVVTDASARMLVHSRQYAGDRVAFEHAAAEHLPFHEGTFDIVVSFLGDPYNLPTVWPEVRRVIRSGGMLVFTTPAFEWAQSFRRKGDSDSAEFLLRNQETVFVPSFVRRSNEQSALFSSCGFRVRHQRTVVRSELPEGPVSTKLLSTPSTSVIEGFLLETSA